MSVYYTFYEPNNMKEVANGNFAGMPFYYINLPCDLIQVAENEDEMMPTVIGLLPRKLAIQLQEIMPCNNTFFTDLMDENGVDLLIYKVE